MFGTVLFIILISLISYLIFFYKKCFTYWSKRNVENLPPKIPLGNLNLEFFRKSQNFIFSDIYKQFKPKGNRYVGFYSLYRPVLVLIDIDLVKRVLISDFHHFTDRAIFCDEKNDPLSGNLFSLKGKNWKYMRTKINPTFTSGKLKYMFHTIVNCSCGISEILDKSTLENNPIDIRNLLSSFTLNVIGSTAFGLNIDCFNDPNSEFVYHINKILTKSLYRKIILLMEVFFPNILTFFQFKYVKAPMDSTKFLNKIVSDVISYREKNNEKRSDFMQLLIDLKKSEKNPDGLEIGQIVAQTFVFLLAGYETSSTLSTFLMYELTQNFEIQTKLRKEINSVLKEYDGQVTYEALTKMEYLEMCLCEAARKYPALPALTRVCTQNYKIPDSDLIVEKGSVVVIPVFAIQYDPEFYPDPEKFDPERFNSDNKKNRIPCTWLPFGDGPRICIGLRFGLLQSKIAIVNLLRNHFYTINSKTKVPLPLGMRSLLLTPGDTVMLNVKRVD